MVIRSCFKKWKDETDAVYASSVTNNAQNYLLHFWNLISQGHWSNLGIYTLHFKSDKHSASERAFQENISLQKKF